MEFVNGFIRIYPPQADLSENGAGGAVGGPISPRAGGQDDVSSQDKLPQIIQKPKENLCFFAFRLPLGGVLRAVFRRLVGVWNRLGLSRGRAGSFRDPWPYKNV